MNFNYFKLDPAFIKVLAPFAPIVRIKALQIVDAYFKAIDSGDEPESIAYEEIIQSATGEEGQAIRALLIVCDTSAVFV